MNNWHLTTDSLPNNARLVIDAYVTHESFWFLLRRYRVLENQGPKLFWGGLETHGIFTNCTSPLAWLQPERKSWQSSTLLLSVEPNHVNHGAYSLIRKSSRSSPWFSKQPGLFQAPGTQFYVFPQPLFV